MNDVTTRGRSLARRTSRLGGEGVFTSAAEANAAAVAGQKIYPFHLGDLGFADAAEHRRGHGPGDARRADRLLPERRHPRTARSDSLGRGPRAQASPTAPTT